MLINSSVRCYLVPKHRAKQGCLSLQQDTAPAALTSACCFAASLLLPDHLSPEQLHPYQYNLTSSVAPAGCKMRSAWQHPWTGEAILHSWTSGWMTDAPGDSHFKREVGNVEAAIPGQGGRRSWLMQTARSSQHPAAGQAAPDDWALCTLLRHAPAPVPTVCKMFRALNTLGFANVKSNDCKTMGTPPVGFSCYASISPMQV